MSNFKKLVEARMAATGEGWQRASAWVRAQVTTNGATAEPAPREPSIPSYITPQKYPVDERYAAITALYAPADSRREGRLPAFGYRDKDGNMVHGGIAQYVHIAGTRFSNTTWHLSNEAEGAKLRISMSEPVSRQGIIHAFHQAVCPLLVETSSDGGRTWTHHPDPGPKKDWETALSLASVLLNESTKSWNVARVSSARGEELVRYYRPDHEDTPVYVHEAGILADALKRAIPGHSSITMESGPMPSVTVRHSVTGTSFVLVAALFNGRIYVRAVSDEQERAVWGIVEIPLNEDGARAAASQMIEWVQTQKIDLNARREVITCTMTCTRAGCTSRAFWEDGMPTPILDGRPGERRIQRDIPAGWILAPISVHFQMQGENCEHLKGVCPKCQTFKLLDQFTVTMTDHDFVVTTAGDVPYGRFRGQIGNWAPVLSSGRASKAVLNQIGKMIDERFSQLSA
ncbi:MAG TPA: hypothetical protein VGI39_38900 [Polyangiaceae bacterium]|jgi:hypothetical protein